MPARDARVRVARHARSAPPCARVSRVLFCPFCRESFEGEAVCPEHELPLVEWTALAPSKPPPRDDLALPFWSLAHGRGLVLGGAIVTLIAFLTLPLAEASGALRMGGTMLKLALLGSPKLWIVCFGAIAQLAMLARRRTLGALRSARIAVVFVGLVPGLAALWAYRAALVAAHELAAREGAPIHVHPALGAFALAFGALLMIAGALRLGASTAAPR